MKTTLFMAMSLNGIIARIDGSEDFLSHENWRTFSSLVSELGNFIVGSRTYEAVAGWDEDYGFDDFTNATKLVVSDDANYPLADGYLLAPSPKDAIRILQERGFENALLTGGATNNASFAKEGLIDEVVFNIEPVVVGEGISVFQGGDFQLNLNFKESKSLTDGILQVRYEVEKL